MLAPRSRKHTSCRFFDKPKMMNKMPNQAHSPEHFYADAAERTLRQFISAFWF
ncbi:hypothetical protein [Undibacterium baiyunense]|uniref:Uncharacterized protein n=1 Tax=Undibacterium baiyunense TaxID=2828731 RepID=A0A941DAQ3_9BURK|nr:hypothetical protein [Undibacterium baiyunense]MBR7745209.1 hypothetical protein [Undibacterium baiyunense]